MNYDLSRLWDMLSGLGFDSCRRSDIERSYTFVRERPDNRLYEWITCAFAEDAVFCDVEVSVTRLVGIKGLTESRILLEVAADKERAWTVIKSAAELHAWEDLVVEHAIPRVFVLANEIGPELMERTQEARRLASKCLQDLDELGTPDEALRILKNRVSSDQREVARRLAEWPGVLQEYDAEDVYELTCLAVVTFVRHDKLPDLNNDCETPLKNPQLMWEIQLIADALLSKKR